MTETGESPRPDFDPLRHVPEREDRLGGVRTLARGSGVILDVIDGERIFLRNIENCGAKGAGSRVLGALCEQADKIGARIALNVLDDAGYLIDLYERLGFAIDSPDDEDGTLMVRQPRKGRDAPFTR